MRQEKQKNSNNKRREEKAKSKSQDCCVTFKPKIEILLLRVPEANFCIYIRTQRLSTKTVVSSRSSALEDIARRIVCNSTTEIPYWWHKSMFHYKSGSHGVPNANLFNFTFLLVDLSVVCSSAKELQQNSNASYREEYVPQMLTVLL